MLQGRFYLFSVLLTVTNMRVLQTSGKLGTLPMVVVVLGPRLS